MMYNQYFAIEKKARAMGIPVNRDEVVSGLTQGRTKSLKDLSPGEYRELLHYMNQLVAHQRNADEVHCDKMRKKLIATLCKMGYTLQGRPDLLRINAWCVEYGHGHKMLNAYMRQELPKLINQAEIMYTKFLDEL